MKITVVKKGNAKADSVCPWCIEIMDQGNAKADSVCPWCIEIMDRPRRS